MDVVERSWLDTETQALLHPDTPATRTGVEVGEYSLVLIAAGLRTRRLIRAVVRVRRCAKAEAASTLDRGHPQVIASGLSYEDALLGQFEFVCCDATSVFVHDDVAHRGNPSYLSRLYSRLRQSDEFGSTTVVVHSVPNDEDGPRYLDQFLGTRGPLPLQISAPRKKARIMLHWATKIGANVTVLS